MNAMNTNNTNNTNVQSLTAAIAALTKVLEEAIDIAKEESTTATTGTTTTTTEVTATTETATTATETTATTTTETTATETTTATTATETTSTTEATTATTETTAVAEFKGSMNEQDPMDPMPSAKTAEAAENVAQEITDETATEETVDEANTATDEMLGNIIADISTLYDISTYTLENEGYNIGTDHSPYAPMDNRSASFDNYKVYISKEIIKGDTEFTGEFRMIVSEKNSGVKVMDHSLKIINDHIKASSSENTARMDNFKDSKKLFRLLEIVDEVSNLIMSKYSK